MIVDEFYVTDLNSVNKWLAKRDEPVVELRDLPITGFIIRGICAAFLRRCEGNALIFDSLVTNPYASPETRDRALDDMFVHIVRRAKGKRLLGFTRDINTRLRAEKHGFKEATYSVMVKEC